MLFIAKSRRDERLQAGGEVNTVNETPASRRQAKQEPRRGDGLCDQSVTPPGFFLCTILPKQGFSLTSFTPPPACNLSSLQDFSGNLLRLPPKSSSSFPKTPHTSPATPHPPSVPADASSTGKTTATHPAAPSAHNPSPIPTKRRESA